jgi:KipI family sensor histidine kinase inhibitor
VSAVTRAGDRGLLVDLGPVPAVTLHAARRRVREVAGVTACIAGEQSLLVLGSATAEVIVAAIDGVDSQPDEPGRLHRLHVSFAAEYALDLPELLDHARLSLDHFLSRVGELKLIARYLGFRAGFAYLEGWPAEWQRPRRATARPRVPAGSFATAGTMAGFYPIDSPGGWNILGRTAAPLWDSDREPPNLIAAGDEIVLVPTLERIKVATPEHRSASRGPAFAEVIAPGQLTLIVGAADEQRLELGLAAGGAFDAEAAADANAAVGNATVAGVLECALTGPTLRFAHSRRCAWRGAAAEIRVDSHVVGTDFQVNDGQTLTVGRLRGGLRGWLAVAGGIDPASPRYAVAPRALRRGEALREDLEQRSHAETRSTRSLEAGALRVLTGPHTVPDSLLQLIAHTEWEVTPLLDRVGVRLRSLVPIESELLASSGSLPSCGAQFGTVQWHPNGELVILGPDHPVTGGYLQPFTLRDSEKWKVARLLPGDVVRWSIE